ncbi:MAG: hypothetical protein JSR78_17890 [Proteobacteria bacterium]|nr:hypothetical protein [Pseudomonadota bacterium]
MLTDDSQVESDRLFAGNVSRGTFEAAVNVARRRDGGFTMDIPMNVMFHRRWYAHTATNTPSGSRSKPYHRRPRIQ